MEVVVGGIHLSMKLLQELSSSLNRLFLFELKDGNRIEAVFYRGDTLCISTQVGCAVGCKFCLSGSVGLLRNLSTEEIFGQYQLLKGRIPIRRIAIAGIGEPLMNLEKVLSAFWEFKRAGLRVSFYTTGFPYENLRKLLHLPHNGISLSIHSLREDVRKFLLPHGGRLERVLRVLEEELPKMSPRRRKKISLAYLLIKGFNDLEEDIHLLGNLAKALRLSVTLLRYNQTVPSFEDVGDEHYHRLFLMLRSMGVRVTLSTRFRRDELGGCGRLLVNRA